MEIVYSKIISVIADTITTVIGLKQITLIQSDKKKVKNSIKYLEKAIRKTVEHIDEIDSSKYSDEEIAQYWKEAGERISLVPNLNRNAYYIFQKELYWRSGKSKKFINNKDKITMKSMLLLVEKLRIELND